MLRLIPILSEDLRKWFGKGPTGGWDRYNTKGEKVGKCGDSEEGSAYAACLSNEKAAKLGKDGRAAFVKRKRAAQKDAGDAKKGGEKKKGQKPTFVKTGVSESSKEDIIKDLDRVKSDLLKKVDVLVAKKKKLYSNVDIESPMSADEKKLDKDIADLFSQINKLVLQKRSLKEEWSQKYKNSIDCNNPKGFSQRAHCQGKKKNESMNLEEKVNLFLEKNCPTDPAKWSASKAAAKKKFDVYPSAYANGWAAKNYKGKGGGWRKCNEGESNALCEDTYPSTIDEACWDGYKQVGMKDKGGRQVPNCVPESVNEGLYFVGYNKGRGQGTGVFKDSYSSYKDAKKAVEKLEKERGGSYNMIAYYVADKDGKFVRETVNEARGVKSVQKDLDKVIDNIQSALAQYKAHKGTEGERKHVENLKKLNILKKKLEAELNSVVSGLYKDVELKIED